MGFTIPAARGLSHRIVLTHALALAAHRHQFTHWDASESQAIPVLDTSYVCLSKIENCGAKWRRDF